MAISFPGPATRRSKAIGPNGGVWIDRVVILGRDSEDLECMRLAAPTANTELPDFELEIRGWVAGRRSRVLSVEVLCGEEICHETPVDIVRQRRSRSDGGLQGDRCGFTTGLSALSVPRSFSLLLRARLEDGAHVDLAEIDGRRASVAQDGRPRLQPTFVSTPSGRTGTTWAVHLLGQHPSLVAYPPFGVEPRVATYWLEVASALAQPGSYRRALRPQMHRNRWWLGEWPEASRDRIPDEALRQFLGREQAAGLFRWAGLQAEQFYRRTAEAQGKSRPRYFVEKGPLGQRRLEILTDLYPGMREIVMFRDPRDTICSILAYAAARSRVTLVNDEPRMDDAYIEALRDAFLNLLDETEGSNGRALVVRYEDLIGDPAAALGQILRHLGVDDSRRVIEAMIRASTETPAAQDRHRTSGGVEASIGRWQRELEPVVQSKLSDLFAPVLERLDYPIGSNGPSRPGADGRSTSRADSNLSGNPTEAVGSRGS